MIYKTPGGAVFPLYVDMLRQSHLLIAGATGAGKSVLSGLRSPRSANAPPAAQTSLRAKPSAPTAAAKRNNDTGDAAAPCQLQCFQIADLKTFLTFSPFPIPSSLKKTGLPFGRPVLF